MCLIKMANITERAKLRDITQVNKNNVLPSFQKRSEISSLKTSETTYETNSHLPELQHVALTTKALHVPVKEHVSKKTPVAKLKPPPIKVFKDAPVLTPTPVTQTNKEVIKISERKPSLQDQESKINWQDIAEQRRLELADALAENEKLHQQLNELTSRNQELIDMMDQAKYFSSMLHFVMGVGRNESVVDSLLKTSEATTTEANTLSALKTSNSPSTVKNLNKKTAKLNNSSHLKS